MKKIIYSLLLVSTLFADVRASANNVVDDQGSNYSRIEKLEESVGQVNSDIKQFNSFLDFQKDINLENKKLVNECTDNLANTKKLLTKVNDNSTYEEIGRLKSKVSSLETTVSRQDDKIYRLEQRLNTLERRVK